MIDVQVGKQNAQNLIEGIETSRDRGLARVLSSISIRHVGPRVAQLITREYPTIEKLTAASVEDLAAIHEIGEAIAAECLRVLPKRLRTANLFGTGRSGRRF